VPRCRTCFDELEDKALVCPRCGEATEYYRAQSRLRLWLRLLGYYALFALIAVLIVRALLGRGG
jgi:hypothetical protein